MFKKASGKNWVEALADRIAPLAEAERRRREAAADAAWRKALAAGIRRREANRAAKARQAMREAKARKPRKANDARLELPGRVMLLARLELGRWYASGEIKALLPEYAAGSVRAWIWQRCVPAGYLERAPNADHDAGRALGRQSEGRWLYRITPAGQGVVLAAKERVGR